MPQTSSLPSKDEATDCGTNKKDTTFNRISAYSSIHERLLIGGTAKNTDDTPLFILIK